MIKVLIFDVGGVITFTDFETLYSNFAQRVGLSMDFFENYYRPHFQEMVTGKISLENLWEEMRKAGARSELDYKKIWLEEASKVRKVNEELLKFIDSLRGKYKVGILSNLTPTRHIVDEEIGLYKYFDFSVLSFEVGCRKPDQKIFEIALNKAETKAEEVIFIDDREEMTKAAWELGIKSIVYKDNQQLFLELSSVDIL